MNSVTELQQQVVVVEIYTELDSPHLKELTLSQHEGSSASTIMIQVCKGSDLNLNLWPGN